MVQKELDNKLATLITEGSVKCLLGLGRHTVRPVILWTTPVIFLFSFNKLLFVPDMFEFFIVHKMFLKKSYFPPQMFLNVLEFDYTLSVYTEYDFEYKFAKPH